jgi:hypothetical protein
MKRREHIVDYELDDGDDIVADGGHVRVRMNMLDHMDADQREVVHDQLVRDKLAAHNHQYSSHRPGYVVDAMRQGAGQTINDSSYDLHERRGCWLPDAVRARDEAFEAVERRSLWRDATPDNQNRNQSGQGEAMGRYSWTAEQMAILKEACDILGITVPEDSYAPLEDLHQRLIGLGPVGSEGDNPASATRTNGNTDAAAAMRDAAFADLQRRSENAWRGARR